MFSPNGCCSSIGHIVEVSPFLLRVPWRIVSPSPPLVFFQFFFVDRAEGVCPKPPVLCSEFLAAIAPLGASTSSPLFSDCIKRFTFRFYLGVTFSLNLSLMGRFSNPHLFCFLIF